MPRRSYHTHKKRILALGTENKFSRGTQRVIPIPQDSAILPAQVANRSVEFGLSCLLTEQVIL